MVDEVNNWKALNPPKDYAASQLYVFLIGANDAFGAAEANALSPSAPPYNMSDLATADVARVTSAVNTVKALGTS